MNRISLATVKEGQFFRYNGVSYCTVEIYDLNRCTYLNAQSTGGRIEGFEVSGKYGPIPEVELLDKEPPEFKSSLKNWTRFWSGAYTNPYNGADPEVFVLGKDKTVLEAWKFLKAKKETPSGDPYWDGFQAEFNILPSTCLNAQNDSTHHGLMRVLQLAQTVDAKAHLTPQSTVDVSIEKLLEAKDEHVTFGCAPSMNAYGLEGFPVDNPRRLLHRFAGGHIHKSYPGLTPARARQVVKAIDMIVGVPSIAMFAKLDNPIRRQFYGLPGEFRLPAHGLEYRVLSSAWLCHPAIAQLIRTMVRAAVIMARAQLENVFSYTEEEVVNIILDHDVDAAKKFVERNRTQYEKLVDVNFYSSAGYEKTHTVTLKALSSPVDSLIDPMKMEENWGIGKWTWQGNSGHPGTTWASFASKQ